MRAHRAVLGSVSSGVPLSVPSQLGGTLSVSAPPAGISGNIFDILEEILGVL